MAKRQPPAATGQPLLLRHTRNLVIRRVSNEEFQIDRVFSDVVASINGEVNDFPQDVALLS